MDFTEVIKENINSSLRAKQEFLADNANISRIAEAAGALIECYERGGKVLVFGNGGSAADSQHMAAELVVRFMKERRALPCVALSANTSILTAAGNDYDFDAIFSKQVEALGGKEDIAFALSTSGNSPNVIKGVHTAAKKGIKVIALTGKDGGKLKELSDIPIVVNNSSTARIQEIHILVIHILCQLIEDSVV